MKRDAAFAFALATLLLVPGVHAAVPEPEFPDPLAALVPGWIADAEALAAGDQEKDWWPEAQKFLDSAKDAQKAGRVRSAMFDVETFTELVLTGRLTDEAAPLPSDAERKGLILQRTSAWHTQALGAWDAYRQELDDVEDEIHALHALEIAAYSADLALGARLLTDDREGLAREYPKQSGSDRGYVLALVRASRTALLELEWASDILGLAGSYEGLPPRVNETAWEELAAYALLPPEGSAPSQAEPIEKVAVDIRENNESVMAVVINLAEQRAARAQSIFIIYGDAQSRGLNVTSDAGRAMKRQLENATMDEPRGYGLLGVFTADSIDRAMKTSGYLDQGLTDLGVVIGAWSALDHAKYVAATLGTVSPIQPPPVDETPTKKTPVAAWGAMVGIAVGAILRSRRIR